MAIRDTPNMGQNELVPSDPIYRGLSVCGINIIAVGEKNIPTSEAMPRPRPWHQHHSS